MNPHDEQKITARDEGRKARAARRASAAAFLPANDRFKQSYSGLTYLCVILATVAHFAVFEFFPQLQAADLGVVRPHGLRHASISTALDITGGDVRKVMKFSRHTPA